MTAEERKGVGGWLLLFVVGQALAVLITLVQLPGVLQNVFASWATLGEVAGYRPLLVVEVLGNLGLIAGGVYGLFLILKTAAITPKYYTWFLGGLALYGAVYFLGLRSVGPTLIGLIQESGEPIAEYSEEVMQGQVTAGRTCAYALIWLIYWRISQRVTNTWPG